MLFGLAPHPADTVVGSTDWIEPSLSSTGGTVGGLVPNQFEAYLRVFRPGADPDDPDHDWWSAYGRLFEVIAAIGAKHTSTPQRALFAIWEGHGYEGGGRSVAWKDPPADEAERLAREVHRAQVRDEHRRKLAAIRVELAKMPRFDLPHRSHYLFEAPVMAVANVRYPGDDDRWRNPDLFWPHDRRWFVATDVDIWSLYIGGTHEFIAELAQSVPTRSESVGLDYTIEMQM